MENNLLPTESGFKMGFVNLLKWVQRDKKVGYDAFSPTFETPKPTCHPILDPFQDIDKTHLKPTFSGSKLFSKKGPEAALTQHKSITKYWNSLRASISGGALKERRRRRAEKRSSKKATMDSNMFSLTIRDEYIT